MKLQSSACTGQVSTHERRADSIELVLFLLNTAFVFITNMAFYKTTTVKAL